MKFKNNSCAGIYRSYQGFELEIPGNKTVEIAVPEEHAENVRAFLKQHHPAVEVEAPAPVILASPVAAPAAEETGMFVHDFIALHGLKAEVEAPVEVVTAPAPAKVAVAKAKPAKAAKTAKAPKAPKAVKKTGGTK